MIDLDSKCIRIVLFKMSTTSQISNLDLDYRHLGFSLKILELERDADPCAEPPPPWYA
jgi:hypothetical protein